jgi:Domain of unkown function (DUF1775)
VGQFEEFNVLAQGIRSGTNQLVFKAIQLYSDGTTVAWIQVPSKAVPDSPHPAPIITLTSGTAAPQSSAAPPPATASASASSTGSNAESIAALVLASFAVVLAVLAVWLGRPRLEEPRPRSDQSRSVDL